MWPGHLRTKSASEELAEPFTAMSTPAGKAKNSLRQAAKAALPTPLFRALKAVKKWYLGRVADHLYFPVWLLLQCLRHRRRAVILCRIGALGDVLCTLPLCAEIRKRHPRRLLVFVTAYHKMIRLSPEPEAVYGARSWTFAVTHCFLGLVEKIYAPATTDERSPNAGTAVHLIDDLAGSCGLAPTDRQPRLFPPPELIQKTLAIYQLDKSTAPGCWLIGINGGHSWPVKEWPANKWQELADRLHAEYPRLTIIQFGLTNGPADALEQLRGVRLLSNRLQPAELVALVAACDLVISIDSGPIHIAGAVGTPVVGLFGANAPQFRLPPASPGIGVVADVLCLFCHHQTPRGHWKDGCPHDIRCMKELTVETVFRSIKEMLSRPARR